MNAPFGLPRAARRLSQGRSGSNRSASASMLGPNAVCAKCETPIRDRSTLQERGGKIYCCNNCAGLDQGTTAAADSSCAQCGLPIVLIATQVERNGRTYCCLNCAEVAEVSAAG